MWQRLGAAVAPDAASGMTADASRSAFSAARSIRFTAGISTSASAAEAALGLTAARRGRRRTFRRIGRSRSRRAITASRWWRWPSADRAGWRASDIELAHDGAVVHDGHAATVSRARLRGRRELFFVIGADAFAEIESWKDTRRSSIARTSPSCRGRASRSTNLPTRLPALAARGWSDRSHAGRRARTPLDLFDRCADRRCVIDCDPPAARERRNRSTGLVPPAVRATY